MSALESWGLLFFFALYFGIVFVWPSIGVWRATGINPYAATSVEGVHRFTMRGFRFLLIGLAFYLFGCSLYPSIYVWSGPLIGLERRALQWIGWLFLAVALVWTTGAQMHMGLSWRIGIDKKNASELVTRGLFSISRNPVFLGMRCALWGFFLAQPNAITLTIAAVGDILMQVQARLEEEHLVQAYGDTYVRYRQKVRRWL